MVFMVTPANDPLHPKNRRRGAGPARTGLPTPEPVASTDDATVLARDLEARHPGWVVLWRHWARRHWAFAAWLPSTPGPIEARNVQDLLAQMDNAELQHRPSDNDR